MEKRLLTREDFRKDNVKKGLLLKLSSDEARERYIKNIEVELEKATDHLKEEHKDSGNLSEFVAERRVDIIIDLLEVEVVLSKKYMSELTDFLRLSKDSDYCDCGRLVSAAKAFRNLDMNDLYVEFANLAIEKELETEVGCIAIVWAANGAEDLGMKERAEELNRKAVLTIISDLDSMGVCAFGNNDFSVVEMFTGLAEGLGMMAEKEDILNATLEAFEKEDKDGSNSYEIGLTLELIGKNKAKKFYKLAMEKAELNDDFWIAESIAKDAGWEEIREVYTTLQSIKQYVSK